MLLRAPTNRRMFFTIVNKLAQVCDFQPAGDTVTALAVIRQNGRICHVLAADRRGTGVLRKARAGLSEVLGILRSNLESQTPNSDAEMEQKLFRKILELNSVRVRSYLNALSREIRCA